MSSVNKVDTKIFYMTLKSRTGIETGKVIKFTKMLRIPHPKADWRMEKWAQIMRIPTSILVKNEYLCGALLFGVSEEYLKERGVKIPEPDDKW